nr:choice-of-anchor D domain-containing protein [Cyclonatronum proteinivorum]
MNAGAALASFGGGSFSANETELDFNLVVQGFTAERSFRLTNSNADPVTVNAVTSDHGTFTVDFSGPVTLNFGQSITVTVTFAPQEIGSFNGEITVESDDAENGIITIALIGEGIGAPQIGLNPTVVSASGLSGRFIDATFDISNSGDGTLLYTIPGFTSSRIFDPSADQFSEIRTVLLSNYLDMIQSVQGDEAAYTAKTILDAYFSGNLHIDDAAPMQRATLSDFEDFVLQDENLQSLDYTVSFSGLSLVSLAATPVDQDLIGELLSVTPNFSRQSTGFFAAPARALALVFHSGAAVNAGTVVLQVGGEVNIGPSRIS